MTAEPLADDPVAGVLDGVPVVSWTAADGCRVTAVDRCPHRRAPLSAGRVEGGVLRCAYHGWAFGAGGACVDIPALGPDARIPGRAGLTLIADDPRPTPSLGPEPGADADWLDGDTPGLERFWHPVCRREELGPGATTSVELLGERWELEHRADGRLAARRADGLPAADVRVHLDHVWLAPEEPLAPLPPVAEWGGGGWHHVRMTRKEGRFGVGLLLDNQLDAGHFPFVHVTTFGTPDAAVLPHAVIERAGPTASSVLRIPIAARNDAAALRGEHDLHQHRTMTYGFHAPLWLSLRLDYEQLGGSTLLLFAFVPLARGRARMDVDILFRKPEGFTPDELEDRLAFEEQVVAEDLRLQRLFDDLRLPLDPAVERHTKADRYSLACRQLIRDLLRTATTP